LDLELDYGFEISRGSADNWNDDFKAISKIIGSDLELLIRLDKNSCLSNEFDEAYDDEVPMIYYVKNTFKGKEKTELEKVMFLANYEIPNVIFNPSNYINNLNKTNLIYDYLYPLIKKMRLFKEGNICMPFHYCYILHNNAPKLISGIEYGSYVVPDPYTLNKSEINEFKNNIPDIKLPFTQKFLQLAFENFELSYEIQNKNMQFLTLMNALEILLKPSSAKTELTYRLSRNGAVLLGKDDGDSERIYKELKCLYAIRSSIVHTGEIKNCKKNNGSSALNHAKMIEKIRILRHYVRESLKEMKNAMELSGKNKDEVLNIFNSRGFGENPWKD
jgi:hypothetical protein